MTDTAINVSNGDVYANTTLTDGDGYFVYSGGRVINTQLFASVDGPDSAPNGASIQVFSGGLASGTEVNSATTQYVAQGGTLEDTRINPGGTEYVGNGGTAFYTDTDNNGDTFNTSNSDAVLYPTQVVSAGGKPSPVFSRVTSNLQERSGKLTKL